MEQPPATSAARSISRPGEAVVAGGVLLALLLLVLPPVPLLLDILLAANILVSTLLLLLVLPLSGPLELRSFPSLLLLTGLLRLALAVGAARLIIREGAAGGLIEVLGGIVSGGSRVAGLSIAAALAVVLIAVIASGAGRAAEVAARFSLDALPGKQFGIDSSLSAKAIDASAAERQRRELQAEADFYGAMDGATRFARGEAIACVIIIALTFVAGVGLELRAVGLGVWGRVLSRYSALAAWEAAAILIPGLMTCYAAALMVTKGAASAGVASDLAAGARANRGALWVVAGLLALLGLAARPPNVPLLLAAVASAAWGLWAGRRAVLQPSEASAEPADEDARDDHGVTIRLGMGLLGLLGQGADGRLFERAREAKDRLSRAMRAPLPSLTVSDDPSLPTSVYVISCCGEEVARGRLMMSRVLVTADDEAALPGGARAADVGDGKSVWIAPEAVPAQPPPGWTVRTPCHVLLDDFERALRGRMATFIGRDAASALLEQVRAERPVLVADLERAGVGLGTVRQLMIGLADEGVALSDPMAVLEAVADAAAESRHPAALIETARRALATTITRLCASPDGVVRVVALGPNVERYIRDDLEDADDGETATLPAEAIGALRARIERAGAACLLCTPEVRRSVRQALADFLPDLRVVASEEIVSDARMEVLGQVDAPPDLLNQSAKPPTPAAIVDGDIL